MYIKSSLNLNTKGIYNNMTVRNNEYHLLDDTSKIYKYDEKFNFVDTEKLDRNFKLLTYNENDYIYLMSLENSSKNLKKVNFNYEEYADLIIKNTLLKIHNLKDIYYDKYHSRYLIADKRHVFSIDKDGNFLKNEVLNDEFYDLKIDIDCCQKEEIINPKDFSFTAVGTDGKYKYVAYTKNKSAFIAKISENGSKIDDVYVGDNIVVNSIVFNNKKMLALANDKKNDIIYEIEYDLSKIINPKLEEIINKLIELLNNVSINEVGVSTIINTEMEKVKKIMETTKDPNIILEANNSATKMITEAVGLEDAQYNNLLIILETIKELESYLN